MAGVQHRQTDCLVIGSGPAGATLARDVARAGHAVLVLERGPARDHASPFRRKRSLERVGLTFSEEGMHIQRAYALGGSGECSHGVAFAPASGICAGHDLRAALQSLRNEIGIERPAREHLGAASIRLQQGADDLGLHWQPHERLPSGWRPQSMLNTAGIEIETLAEAIDIRSQNGAAFAVEASLPGGSLVVEAKAIVLAAGGIGSALLLQRSGVAEAGAGLAINPSFTVYGIAEGEGSYYSPSHALGEHYSEDGFMLSQHIGSFASYAHSLWRKGIRHLRHLPAYSRVIAISVSIADDTSGAINIDGEISKTLSDRDRIRMNRGATLARRILLQSGVAAKHIWLGSISSQHVCATASHSDVCNERGETALANVFIADSSRFPKGLGYPGMLSSMALARRTANVVNERLATERQRRSA